MKNYSKWLRDFMDSWKNLEGEKTCDLFADTCQYYENPFAPTTNKEEIKKLWAAVPLNQKDIIYKGEIFFEDKEHCIYHFCMARTMLGKKQLIDGIFEIKLNDKNLLTYFKQWRFAKEA